LLGCFSAQSAKYLPVSPFNSGHVATYTIVAAPCNSEYMAFSAPKKEVHITTGFYYSCLLLHIELPPFTAFDKKNLPKDAWH
jgi:hypothetical protein